MSIQQTETFLKSLLHGKFSSLSIEFNDHASGYQDAAKAAENLNYDYVDWISDEDKAKALSENSVWVLHWYPNSPVGFNAVAASSLELLLTHVQKEMQNGNDSA